MTRPEKAAAEGDDWLQAILPNPFIVSENAREEPLPATPVRQTISPENGSSQFLQSQTPKLVLEENTRGFLADYLPDFAGELPQPIPILDSYDEWQTPLQTESQFPKSELDDGAVASPKDAPQLRGIGLIGAVFSVLSKQLGTEYSTAELMLAAQQLIDISKAEYVGIPYKNIGERAGYYSWDLVRAFTSHQWQIAEVESNRMDLIAPNIEVAEYMSALLEELEHEKPMLVHSQMANAEARIASFKNTAKRWLVSVAMISEGVDIKRLRILVYLPYAQTELAFRQAMGRVVRSLGDDDYSRAYVVMPTHRILEEYARRVELEMSPNARQETQQPNTKRCPRAR